MSGKYIHPCDLCGSQNRVVFTGMWWTVLCTRKGCPKSVYDFVAKTYDEAVDNWNDRFSESRVK